MRFYFFLFLTALTALCRANVITLCPSCEINDFAKGIQSAAPFDTILVKPGTYASINTIINKPLTVIGEHYPIIDGQQKDEVITVLADHVSLIGLDIRNTNLGSLKDYAGIRIFKSHYTQVFRCHLRNVYFGIYISDASHTTVKDNVTIGADYAGSDRGNGIHLWKCDSILIEGNRINNHRDGIYFEFSKHCTITNNLSANNIRYGLHFMFSDYNTYIRNTFRNNGTGVAVMYTDYVQMYNNVFEDNWGDAAYGLLLKDINSSIIVGNTFRNNTIAVTMEGSSRMRFENNDFIKNGYGLKIMANCESDTFRRNNFTGNTFDAATNGVLVNNLFAYNYWDKYEGYDLNRDKIGDVPYKPVSLYSMIIEQMPYAVILLRSFLVDLLDRAEKNIPGIMPDTFQDATPVMTIIKR